VSHEALQAAQLLAQAVEQTGLGDWGEADFETRFTAAVDAINAQGLDQAGLQLAEETVLGLLADRLRFFEDAKTHQLNEEIIERPLFITGEPRSGTTLLHALLASDPNNRALRFWAVMQPSPPPGLAKADDPRFALADQYWREINTRLPQWLRSHPYNDMLGDGLAEDERTWAMDFRVMTPTAWWRVPMGMVVSGIADNPQQQYRIHKMMLQAIQHQQPKKHWVLKGFHAGRFAALFEAYPDAQVIYLHREPLTCIASRIQMAADITAGLLGASGVDMTALSKLHTQLGSAAFEALPHNAWMQDSRVHSCLYTDFVADPTRFIGQIYDRVGRSLTDQARAAIGNYLTQNKPDRYGRFEYSRDLIAGDIRALSDRLEPYRERFGLPSPEYLSQ